MRWSDIRNSFVQQLKEVYPAPEAENIFRIVFEYIAGKDVTVKYREESELTADEQSHLDKIIRRLQNHEPIQYIINECWFYDIPFYVDQNVLIPRPETEELVDWIIRENAQKKELSILDVGTGSGCIPIILKRKLCSAKIYACDISPGAIGVAKRNAGKYATNVNFLQLDFLDKNEWGSLPSVDLIVSNPPYIPAKDKKDIRPNVLQYEPHVALFVEDESPLVFYEAIAECGKKILETNGSIYVEIHESLAEKVIGLFNDKSYDSILKKDLQGKDRMIKASLRK